MAIIKGIIAIIFMVTLIAGMAFFVTRMEKIRKNHSFDEDEGHVIFYIVALAILFIVFCVATLLFSICL